MIFFSMEISVNYSIERRRLSSLSFCVDFVIGSANWVNVKNKIKKQNEEKRKQVIKWADTDKQKSRERNIGNIQNIHYLFRWRVFIVTIIKKNLTSQHRNSRSVRLNRVVGFFVFCFIVSFVRVFAIWCWECVVRTNKKTHLHTH